MLEDIIKKIIKQNLFKIVAIAVVFIVLISVAVSYKNGGVKTISAKVAGATAVDYINKNFLAGKEQASFKNAQIISGIYKVTFNFQGNDNDIYLTKDGKYMFPAMQGVPIDLTKNPNEPATNAVANNTQQAPQKTCSDLKKTDNVALSAFIVSKCPFGLQMQRVVAEAIKNVPVLASSIKIRYMSTDAGNGKFTSMHGEEEYQENLRQICIRDEQDAKYWSYVSCFIKKGDSAGCLNSSGVNQGALKSCMSDSSRGTKYIKADYDLQTKFSVSGSPTLIQNDETVSEFSFGGRTADAIKTLVCCGAKTQSGFCSQALSKESAATSFSETYAQGGTGSTGNSGATGANCAPAQ